MNRDVNQRLNMENFRTSNSKNFLVTSVILLVFLLQVNSCGNVAQQVNDNPTPNDDTVRVALLGIAFENIPEAEQQEILNRLSAVIDVHEKIEFIAPEDLQDDAISNIDFKQWSQNPEESRQAEIADLLNVDHLYWGWLENPRGEDREILLDGSLHRFDLHSERSYSMSILGELSTYDETLERFQHHMVETVIPQVEEAEEREGWPIYAVAAFALGGIVAIAISMYQGGSGSVESPNGNGSGNGEI